MQRSILTSAVALASMLVLASVAPASVTAPGWTGAKTLVFAPARGSIAVEGLAANARGNLALVAGACETMGTSCTYFLRLGNVSDGPLSSPLPISGFVDVALSGSASPYVMRWDKADGAFRVTQIDSLGREEMLGMLPGTRSGGRILTNDAGFVACAFARRVGKRIGKHHVALKNYFVAVRAPGGTFGHPVRVFGRHGFLTDVAVDGKGRTLAVGVDVPPNRGRSTIVAVQLSRTGRVVRRESVASVAHAYLLEPEDVTVAVNGRGDAIVGWEQGASFSPATARYAYRGARRRFGPPHTVDRYRTDGDPTVRIDSAGRALMVLGIEGKTRTAFISNKGRLTKHQVLPIRCEPDLPDSVALNAKGDAMVACTPFFGKGLFAMTRSAKRTRFQDPRSLEGRGYRATSPVAVIDDGGRGIVVWSTKRGLEAARYTP